MLLSSNGRERNAVAVPLAAFGDNGEPESDISKTLGQIELDLQQTRRNLHRMRLSRSEWKAIQPGLREVYRQCRKRMERALEQGDDDGFHKWRIRVKNLYYELQMLQPVWPARLNKVVADLEQLQNKIGADHDLIILQRSLHRSPDTFGGKESVEQVLNSLNDKRRRLRRMTEPLGRAIFDRTSRHFVRELGRRWNNWRKTAKPAVCCATFPNRDSFPARAVSQMTMR